MGLEKLLRSLYGSDMQIDLDKQIARARVPKPMPLDFVVLADGVKRNNMGLGGFVLQATAAVREGKVEIRPTGQTFPLQGAPPADPGPAKRMMKVLDWNEPAKTKLEIIP